MIKTPMLLAPESWATVPAPEPALLLRQVATLQLENAALRAENAALQQRIRDLELIHYPQSLPSGKRLAE